MTIRLDSAPVVQNCIQSHSSLSEHVETVPDFPDSMMVFQSTAQDELHLQHMKLCTDHW